LGKALRAVASGRSLAIVALQKSRNGLSIHTDIAFYGIVTAGRFAPGQQRFVFHELTRLRLHGFKSFVEATDFMIEPGLTGVSDRTAAAKSNLVEALRWAMGETSYKSLRATDMEAVIFAGTNGRPARNHAEVVMTIDNADRSAPAAFNDQEILEVSRRIEREAGSVYRINGGDVRARDVQILFADAATGARSPALVHQGKIG
jgi:condensin subunit Smc